MNIQEIAKRIYENGGSLYLVGGAVRDKLLGKQSHDEDYCITGISSENFKNLFPEAHVRGKSFEVFDIDGKEFAMARTETKIGNGHKEFEIKTGKNILIEQDLARRDLTINAIAEDVITKEIIDPFCGIEDIKNGILRATTEKFKEDPLRVYRAARFAAQLKFNIEPKTLELMNLLKDELLMLSKERVFQEFKKALESGKPSEFFNSLKKANVLDVHFKEIYNLIGQMQPVKYHPEGDSYNHTMMAVDKSAELTNRIEVRYAVLVHDLGKGLTTKEMLPHHYGHDKAGVEPVREMSKRIGVPNSWRKCGIISAEEHMRAGNFDKMRERKQVELIQKLDKSIIGLDGMKIVVKCDQLSSNAENKSWDFEIIGKQMLQEVNGKKISLENIAGKQIEETIKIARINWLKNLKRKNR